MIRLLIFIITLTATLSASSNSLADPAKSLADQALNKQPGTSPEKHASVPPAASETETNEENIKSATAAKKTITTGKMARKNQFKQVNKSPSVPNKTQPKEVKVSQAAKGGRGKMGRAKRKQQQQHAQEQTDNIASSN